MSIKRMLVIMLSLVISVLLVGCSDVDDELDCNKRDYIIDAPHFAEEVKLLYSESCPKEDSK